MMRFRCGRFCRLESIGSRQITQQLRPMHAMVHAMAMPVQGIPSIGWSHGNNDGRPGGVRKARQRVCDSVPTFWRLRAFVVGCLERAACGSASLCGAAFNALRFGALPEGNGRGAKAHSGRDSDGHFGYVPFRPDDRPGQGRACGAPGDGRRKKGSRGCGVSVCVCECEL